MLFTPVTMRSRNYEANIGDYDLPYPTLDDPEEVRMCEWRARQGKLITRFVDDCIALAALNTDTNVGLLAHFHSDDFATDPLFIDQAVNTIPILGQPKSTIIRLAGGSRGIGTSGESVLQRRQYISNRVSAMVLRHSMPEGAIATTWIGHSDAALPYQFDHYIDVSVDPAAKLIVVEDIIEKDH